MVRLFRVFHARPRLLASIVAAVAAFLLLPDSARLSTRLLVVWDIGALLYLTLAWTMMGRSGPDEMRRRAEHEDEGARAVLVLTVGAAVASLAAIGAELHGVHDAATGAAWRVVLAGGTIVCSWFFVHTVFALHYAHDCYRGTGDRAGGLAFPGGGEPDYWDFLYFSFTIGAASQTSDVTVADPRLRRFVLAHTILSFFFNATVLALAINVGASLL